MEEAPSDITEAAEQDRGDVPGWLWALGGLIVLGGLTAWALRRRRNHDDEYQGSADEVSEPIGEEAIMPTSAAGSITAAAIEPEPVTLAERRAQVAENPDVLPAVEDAMVTETEGGEMEALVAESGVRARPWLEFAMRPIRAGINDQDAVIEFELTVGNSGDQPAESIRITAFMLTANPNQDAEIEHFLHAPVQEAVLAELTLQPGEGANVGATIALPKDGINVVRAVDRPFFVPMLVADARYTLSDGSEGRTAAAFVIGRLRRDSEKLGPFFLDRGARMHDNVEARLHGEPVRV